MSAIKDYLDKCEALKRFAQEGGYPCLPYADYPVIQEISDRLDALEAQAHEHAERGCQNCNLLVGCKVVLSSGQDCCDFWEQYIPKHTQVSEPVHVVSQSPLPVEVPPPSTLYTNDTERSCANCGERIGCSFSAMGEHGSCGAWKPKPAQAEQGVNWNPDATEFKITQPQAEQGGDDKPKYCISCISVLNENNDLRARLEQAEKENAELKRLSENHDWQCGCGHWNASSLVSCGCCGRTVQETIMAMKSEVKP